MKRKLLITSLISAIILGIIAAVILFFQSKDDIKILSHTKNEYGSVWIFEHKIDQETIRCMSFKTAI